MEIVIETVNPGSMGSQIHFYGLNADKEFVRRSPRDYQEAAQWRDRNEAAVGRSARADEGRYADNDFSFSAPTFRGFVLAVVPVELWDAAGNEQGLTEKYATLVGGAVRKIRKQLKDARHETGLEYGSTNFFATPHWIPRCSCGWKGAPFAAENRATSSPFVVKTDLDIRRGVEAHSSHLAEVKVKVEGSNQ